jgi:hypothetical protein
MQLVTFRLDGEGTEHPDDEVCGCLRTCADNTDRWRSNGAPALTNPLPSSTASVNNPSHVVSAFIATPREAAKLRQHGAAAQRIRAFEHNIRRVGYRRCAVDRLVHEGGSALKTPGAVQHRRTSAHHQDGQRPQPTQPRTQPAPPRRPVAAGKLTRHAAVELCARNRRDLSSLARPLPGDRGHWQRAMSSDDRTAELLDFAARHHPS